MDSTLIVLALVVVLALAFDYINGFHDTANAVATVVSTNVLPGRTAVLMAAAWNFIGAFIGVEVANAIAKDIADAKDVTQIVMAAALIGAIFWNLFTWYYGIPSSSSHALIGALVGSIWCHWVVGGEDAWNSIEKLITSKGVVKTLKGLVLSPLFGMLGGFVLMLVLIWIVKPFRPAFVNRTFRNLQLVSASLMAFAHGRNDAQKSMGIITLALLAYYESQGIAGPADKRVPLWVIISCATAMGLGTASGGWRIMKTMGHKIIKLRPINGFAAETAAAVVINVATELGTPVSTTHVISSSIMGVGASKRVSAVRWGVARRMIFAWILTIPISAAVAAATYLLLHAIFGG